MLLNKEQVRDFLPHREPFLFLDEVEGINYPGEETPRSREELVGVEVTARYRTTSSHPIFSGHFPGDPILPGVIQVEIMAQAGAFVLWPLMSDDKDRAAEVALLSIADAKFKKPVRPDMDLTVKSLCTRVRGVFVSYDAQIYCGETLMSQTSTFCLIKVQ